MTAIKRIFCIVLSLMILTFCSCGTDGEKTGGKETTVNKDTAENVQESAGEQEYVPEDTGLSKKDVESLANAALQKLNVIPEYPAGYPTLEDVSSQYEEATRAIGWIVGTELVATDADYTYMAHGMKYYRVLPDCYLGSVLAGKNPDADKLIYNKETLEAYFATLMTKEDAENYVLDIEDSFEIPRFIESENGELYALPYAFPPAGYGEENTYDLKNNGDGTYTLSVHYTTLDDEDNVEGEHTYNVKYVQEDGRWVFENFRVVKQH